MADITAGRLSGVSVSRPARSRSPFMRKAFPYLLVLPAVLYLLSITLYPGIYAIYRSLYTGKFKLEWAGFANYQQLFADSQFWNSIWNTLLLGSITLFAEFVIAMTLAALVYRDPWVKGFRILFLLPMLFMPSAVAFIWKLMFNDGRIISDLLKRIGLIDHNIDWMISVPLARFVVIFTDVWQWTPFLFIIFVAGLQGQDKEVEEAARLDGASWISMFFNITLPMMRPIIAIALILRGIDILNMFTPIQVITQGAPAGATETMGFYIQRLAFDKVDHGYASAASVLVLIVTVILAQVLVRRFFRSGTEA
jgi:multiple sugar transport system permease protein